MSQSTPGRRSRRDQEQYVPYNARPKEVGTRTGKPMPKNVPRNSDGFEDPSAFFKSPADGLISSRSTRTRREFDSPDGASTSAFITPSAVNRKGRKLSDLAGGSDDEDGSGLGAGLLDEEDILDAHLSSPMASFMTSNPPHVKLPRRSLTLARSPSVGYENLPTPKARLSKGATVPSPGAPLTARKSNIGLSSPIANIDGDFTIGGDMDMGDMGLVDDLAGEDDALPNGINGHRSSETASSPRKKRTGRRSNETPQNDGGDSGSDTGGPSFGFDLNDGGGQDDDDDDADLEQAAIDQENGVDEDEQEQDEDGDDSDRRPSGIPKIKRDKKKPRKKIGVIGQEKAQKKRMRVSRIGLEGDGDDGYQGDFVCRRSGRRHFKPLKYWMGERFEYSRGEYQPAITEVVHIPEMPVDHLSKKARKRGRSQSAKSARRGSEESGAGGSGEGGRWGEEDGWDEETDPIGVVKDFISDKEIQRRIAFPRTRLEPRQVAGSSFKYQKVFGEDMFIAAGVVYIPVGGEKPGKLSKDNAYIFFVIAGAVQVTVHRTSFVVAPGGMFMVPRGNHYKIENISPNTEAEMFFAQARKISTNESDEAAKERLREQSQARSDARARSSSAVVEGFSYHPSQNGQNANGGEDEEATVVTPKVRKRKSGIGRT